MLQSLADCYFLQPKCKMRLGEKNSLKKEELLMTLQQNIMQQQTVFWQDSNGDYICEGQGSKGRDQHEPCSFTLVLPF